MSRTLAFWIPTTVAILALVVSLVAKGPIDPTSSSSSSSSSSASPSMERFDSRLEALEAELSELRQQFGALERRLIEADRARNLSENLSPQERELYAQLLLEGRPPSASVIGNEEISPLEKHQVRRVLSEIRDEEFQRQLDGWAEREREKNLHRVEKLRKRLNLSESQKETVVGILTDESTARHELFTGLWIGRNAEAWSSLDERLTILREERDERLRQALTPWQLEELERIDQEERRPRKEPATPEQESG